MIELDAPKNNPVGGPFSTSQRSSRLTSSGNERISNALGQPATVYVAIPAGGEGTGKIQLTMHNRIVEYPAVTDQPEPLPSGEAVEVVQILNRNLVQVRRA